MLSESTEKSLKSLSLDYSAHRFNLSYVRHADCFDWFKRIPENSLHAIVTDPPYGVKEYELGQLEKRNNDIGVHHFHASQRCQKKNWRLCARFFTEWAHLAVHALRPGGHVFIASNTFLSQAVFAALVEGGLEYRGQLIRLVQTLRGGDRPKNAEKEFPNVSSLPRGGFEPGACCVSRCFPVCDVTQMADL